MLPVEHCIRGTYGWEIRDEIAELLESGPIDKPTFGSETLGKVLKEFHKSQTIHSITLVGLCTDICVISNASAESIFAGGANCCGFPLLCRRNAQEP